MMKYKIKPVDIQFRYHLGNVISTSFYSNNKYTIIHIDARNRLYYISLKPQKI